MTETCTFLKTGRDFERQDVWACATCNPEDFSEGCLWNFDHGKMFCKACVKKCHNGHILEHVGRVFAFCDCPDTDRCLCCETETSSSADDVLVEEKRKSVINFVFGLFTIIVHFFSSLKLFSPYSISTAMGLLQIGSFGMTRTALERFTGCRGNILPAIKQLHESLNSSGCCRTANMICSNVPIRKEFEIAVDGIAEVTHGIDVSEINRKVDVLTEHMIPKVLNESDVNGSGIVFGNVVYFNGKFEHPFRPELTSDATFHGIDGDTTVKMMKMDGETFNSMEDENVQVIEMPYKNHDFSFGIVLPNDGSVPKISSPTELNSYRSKFHSNRISRLCIPKFTKHVREDISEQLRRAGLSMLFESSADFSGMTLVDAPVVKVIHDTIIEVTEEGTRATAATFGCTKGLGRYFVADHPFTYYVRGPKGVILFVGVFDGSK